MDYRYLFVTYVESPTNKIQHARDQKAAIDACKKEKVVHKLEKEVSQKRDNLKKTRNLT